MTQIAIASWGAVSPAGWNAPALYDAIQENRSLEISAISRPGNPNGLRVRRVPPPSPRPPFLTHNRLRRTSSISQFAMGSAMEAISPIQQDPNGLGIILCVMAGCVSYSRRFYDETLRDPATASPLIFPETVFNAPASHIAAFLGARGQSLTLVGDPGTFLIGLATAANWLLSEQVDSCVVVGAEEADWLSADAFQLFEPEAILSEGAGALLLKRDDHAQFPIELSRITQAHRFLSERERRIAASRMRAELPDENSGALLCEGQSSLTRFDTPEKLAWNDWQGPRIRPKSSLGEGLAAGSAWQCVAAAEALSRGDAASAHISVVGCNQQAVGALFARRS